uniref:U-scoloptoxin(22)-Cw1a n=1 Tax=Cormocephalus westwoodi TaxID=1096223 RepID=TXM1A_CORWE|nr:RecName: Full=U-scoloptoxin(22)-Cw1a; Short=U-SLPTX(22)-Cw1a; Flags: Precursor [Cormocephalus westwoodi]
MRRFVFLAFVLVLFVIANLDSSSAQVNFSPDWGQGKRSGSSDTCAVCAQTMAQVYRLLQGLEAKLGQSRNYSR